MNISPTGILWTLVIAAIVFGGAVAFQNWRRRK